MRQAQRTAATNTALWTQPRLGLAAAALFVAQVILLMLVAQRARPSSPTPRIPASFQSLLRPLDQSQAAQSFFAADPVVFSSPSPHGFSGRAWIIFSPKDYRTPQELEPPSGLALNANHLARKLSSTQPTNLVPFGLVEQLGPQLEPLPVPSEPAPVRTHSAYSIDGPLSAGLLEGTSAPPLRSWASPQLLTNSVVDFATDNAGMVVAWRLVGSCGLHDADEDALRVASQFHFKPSRSRPRLLWSRAVFQWQTVEPDGKH